MFAGALVSCSADGPGKGPGKGNNMVLKSANIKDSKCLFVQGGADTRAEEVTYEHGLFKIDDNGNITSVMITYVYNDKTGETTETRSDMHVYPQDIFEVGSDYLLFYQCDYYWDDFRGCTDDEDREYKDICPGWLMTKCGSEYDLSYLLVRKSDGNIYSLDAEIDGDPLGWIFSSGSRDGIALNGYTTYAYTTKNGTTYVMSGAGKIYKIAVNNGTTQVQQVTSNNFDLFGSRYFVADNGTILLRSDMLGTTLFYPNGGVGVIESDENNDENWFFPYSDGVMHITIVR